MRDHVRFFLNGREQVVRGESAFQTLTEYLRLELGLVGTKVVCAEGDCGACTVLVGRVAGAESSTPRLRYVPIDGCIQLIYQLDGTHVVTIEGLACNGELHPVQQALVDCHGSQCGYCTPGIIMALAGWAEAGTNTDPAAMRIALTGNLCRCTGYIPILEAATTIANRTTSPILSCSSSAASVSSLSSEPLKIVADKRIFFAPTNLEDAVAFKAANPSAIIVAGATEIGVLRNKRGYDPSAILSLARIAGLDTIDQRTDRMSFGANVTWSQVEQAVRERLPEFYKIIVRFGSPQIRHAATLVGNVAHGSPIADSLGLLCVMDAQLEIMGLGGTRRRSINGFYTGYRKNDLDPDEIIVRVTLPLPTGDERLRLYKVSRRNDLDIATFGAAIRLQMVGNEIQSAAVAYTGVAPTVVRLPETEAYLMGRPLQEGTFRQAGRVARDEVTPITDVRGSSDFRLQLCENVFRKFYFDEIGAETPAEAMA